MACLLRKEADVCLKSFTIKPSNPLSREIVGMFVRNLHNLSQQDLAEFKKLLEKVSKQARTL